MSDKNKDTILAISRQLGIQSAGDGLLAKIRQTIDLLQEAAAERDQLKARVAEMEAQQPLPIDGDTPADNANAEV